MIDFGFFTEEFDIVAAREGFKSALTFSRAPVFQDIITGIVDPFTNVTTDAEIDRQLRNITVSGYIRWDQLYVTQRSELGRS